MGIVAGTTEETDYKFLCQAQLQSEFSKDPSTKCGALIVNRTHSERWWGHNQTVKNLDYLEPRLSYIRSLKYVYTVHAEMQALMSSGKVYDGTIYVYPFAPCAECAKHIVYAGITRVVTLKPSQDLQKRWASSLQITKNIFARCGVELLEYPEDFLCQNKQ